MECNPETRTKQEICHGCLSSDRSLVILSENTDLFNYLLRRDDAKDPTSISLCWECSAMLRNMRRFQQKIQRAQDIMRLSLNLEENVCLSSLARTDVKLYSRVDVTQNNVKNQDGSNNIENAQGKMSENLVSVKIEQVEIKCEYDSENDLNDNNDKNLDENEEYIIPGTKLDSLGSCPSWWSGNDPLPKKPKLDDDNEKKTEETIEVTNMKHVEAKHVETNIKEKPYNCEICDKRFYQIVHLKTHLRIHTGEKPYSCEVCHKTFNVEGNLKKHIRIHTGEKPYTCEVCQKSFTEDGHLKIHLMTHTGEKPFSCEICHKRFNRDGNLKKHFRTHTGEKPYSCDLCDRRFTLSGELKIHIRMHTGEKPFSCKVCDKRFMRYSDLITHRRTHTNEKPYRCEICDAKFTQSSSLKTHRMIHTGEKPYSCEICDKKFNRKGHLKRHLKVHVDETIVVPEIVCLPVAEDVCPNKMVEEQEVYPKSMEQETEVCRNPIIQETEGFPKPACVLNIPPFVEPLQLKQKALCSKLMVPKKKAGTKNMVQERKISPIPMVKEEEASS